MAAEFSDYPLSRKQLYEMQIARLVRATGWSIPQAIACDLHWAGVLLSYEEAIHHLENKANSV